MKLRFGHVNIFTGTVLILTAYHYGVIVSLKSAELSAYLFGAVIVLCGLVSAKLEEAQEDINNLENKIKELEEKNK